MPRPTQNLNLTALDLGRQQDTSFTKILKPFFTIDISAKWNNEYNLPMHSLDLESITHCVMTNGSIDLES